MGEELVTIEHARREYDGGRIRALDDVSLVIDRGESLAIVGPSGSGKSTLLNVLCGIETVTSGRIVFEGVVPFSPAAWTRLRARRIGIIFQSFNLIPTLTALENVLISMFGMPVTRAERHERALRLLEEVGLADRFQHRPPALSGGERQRVAIARALANEPALILADEPTGNLDSRSASSVMELLAAVQRTSRATLVTVTHDLQLAARASRIVETMDGKIVGVKYAVH